MNPEDRTKWIVISVTLAMIYSILLVLPKAK